MSNSIQYNVNSSFPKEDTLQSLTLKPHIPVVFPLRPEFILYKGETVVARGEAREMTVGMDVDVSVGGENIGSFEQRTLRPFRAFDIYDGQRKKIATATQNFFDNKIVVRDSTDNKIIAVLDKLHSTAPSGLSRNLTVYSDAVDPRLLHILGEAVTAMEAKWKALRDDPRPPYCF